MKFIEPFTDLVSSPIQTYISLILSEPHLLGYERQVDHVAGIGYGALLPKRQKNSFDRFRL